VSRQGDQEQRTAAACSFRGTTSGTAAHAEHKLSSRGCRAACPALTLLLDVLLLALCIGVVPEAQHVAIMHLNVDLLLLAAAGRQERQGRAEQGRGRADRGGERKVGR
jgi:hypothetical protein